MQSVCKTLLILVIVCIWLTNLFRAIPASAEDDVQVQPEDYEKLENFKEVIMLRKKQWTSRI